MSSTYFSYTGSSYHNLSDFLDRFQGVAQMPRKCCVPDCKASAIQGSNYCSDHVPDKDKSRAQWSSLRMDDGNWIIPKEDDKQ